MRTYLGHMAALVSALEIREVAVLGVSMGGLVAMGLAAEPSLEVRDLVVVDVGPSVPSTAFDLLDLYLAGNHRFPDFDALLAHVKRFFAACNLPSELAWRLFAFRGARKLDDGSYVPDYDPAIRIPFRADFRGMERAWPAYDAIAARTLVLRGAQSHVLPADVAEEMTRRGPRATLVTIPGTGHWPALVKPAETAIVARFLAGRGGGVTTRSRVSITSLRRHPHPARLVLQRERKAPARHRGAGRLARRRSRSPKDGP